MTTDLIGQLKKASFFQSLSDDQLHTLVAHSKTLAFQKGDVVFCQGEPAPVFFFVIEGWVTVVKENRGGDQVILHLFSPSDTFAEAAAINMGHYPASAYAAAETQLLAIRADFLKSMIKDDPDIAMHMIAQLSKHLHSLLVEFEQIKTMNAPKRLALFILQQAPKASGTIKFELPFSKILLAKHLSIQPETLSRAIKKLQPLGVHTSRGSTIVVDDLERLKKFAEDA